MTIIDARYLRNRAEVLRACADYIKDQECHDVAVMCARSYELLAIHLDLAAQAYKIADDQTAADGGRRNNATIATRPSDAPRRFPVSHTPLSSGPSEA